MIREIGYGKVNLALQITGRRDDGYHMIDTVFQSIGLCDTITLTDADVFSLTASLDGLPCDETNLAYKAYRAICDYTGTTKGVAIHLDKHIPMAAGLAGGSTDCAAVLRGLNRLWNLGLSLDTLASMGARLGADVPFCVYGGTMRGQGIGDVLTPLPTLPQWDILVVHPHTTVQTKDAYALFDTTAPQVDVDVAAVIKAITEQDQGALIASMGNTFVRLVQPVVPEITTCYDLLRGHGFVPLVSGSGPTNFSLVPPTKDIDTIYTALLQETYIDVYKTTLTGGEYNPHETD